MMRARVLGRRWFAWVMMILEGEGGKSWNVGVMVIPEAFILKGDWSSWGALMLTDQTVWWFLNGVWLSKMHSIIVLNRTSYCSLSWAYPLSFYPHLAPPKFCTVSFGWEWFWKGPDRKTRRDSWAPSQYVLVTPDSNCLFLQGNPAVIWNFSYIPFKCDFKTIAKLHLCNFKYNG